MRLKTGSNAINAVEAVTNFDSSKFSFVSVSEIGSFPIGTKDVEGGTHGTNSSVTISVGAITPVGASKDVVVGSFVLKAKVGSGSGTISVNQGASSAFYNPTDTTSADALGSVAGATVNFTTPSTGGGGGGGGNSGGGSGSGGGGGSTNNPPSGGNNQNENPPASNTAKPKISESKVDDVGLNSAKVAVKTDKPVRVTLRLGVSADALPINIASNRPATTHNLNLDVAYLKPGRTYFYKVVVTDAAGNQTEGEVQSFTTKGYSVTVLILDKDGEPIATQLVRLNSEPQTATTDSLGYAKFTDVAPGIHTVTVEKGGTTYTEEIEVVDPLNANIETVALNTEVPEQEFTLDTSLATSTLFGSLPWTNIGIGLGGLILLLAISLVAVPKIRQRKSLSKILKHHVHTQPENKTASPAPVAQASTMDPAAPSVQPQPESKHDVGQTIAPGGATVTTDGTENSKYRAGQVLIPGSGGSRAKAPRFSSPAAGSNLITPTKPTATQ